MPEQPPKWIFWFLEKTCSERFLDELEGDLLELFDRDVEQHGLRRAKQKFIWKALLSPRWYRLPGLRFFQYFTMQRNYFKVAFRHAFKHKSASVIQFSGLLLGLAATFYIGLFIKNELAYDQMHLNGDNLYRVLRLDPTTATRGHSTSSLHGAALAEEYPFVSMCRFGNDPVKMGEQSSHLVDEFYWADSTFFELFTFPFLHGDPATCLTELNNLVVTESLSRQLFGRSNSLGKTIKVKVYDGDQEFLMKITGVVKDPPRHSHIQFSALGSMANAENLYQSLLQQWGFSWVRTYIQVPGGRITDVEAGLPKLIKKYLGDNISPTFGITFQPFHKVYLHSQDIPKNTFTGSIRNLQIFGAIGLLILLISLMNYVNLATARAVTRTKEVGVRKVLGSTRFSIFFQFIIESLLFIVSSGGLAIALVVAWLPQLNGLLELNLSLKILTWQEWLLMFTALLATGTLAGILPALAMTKLPSLSQNKPAIRFRRGGWPMTRKLFVGIQYAVTLALLVATIVVYQQYAYLKNFDKGFDSDQLLHVAVDDRELQKQLNVLKEKINQVPGVSGVTATGEDLPSELNNTWGLNWNGSNLEKPLGIDIVGVDQDYFDILGLEFKAGQNFTAGYPIDSARSVVINENAQALIGREDLLGQPLIIGGRERKVIGVVSDHHNTTLHSQVIPLAYFIYPAGFRVSPDNLLIKLQSNDVSSSLAQLKNVWDEFSTDPFTYNFVDEAFAEAYEAERRFSTLIGTFTLMAIVISIVGLFGLIHFIAQLKLKEISIRRILGANQLNLMHLLGKDFLTVFIVALLVALPAAYQLMDSWLINYAYHIKINLATLLLAVCLCIGISALVIFYHLQRTSRVNPTDALATE